MNKTIKKSHITYFKYMKFAILGLVTLNFALAEKSYISLKNNTWTENERQDFYHLSEGSDFYPYDWFLRIKSAQAREIRRMGNWSTRLVDSFEQLVGAIPDVNTNKYLVDFIGVTSVWTNHEPTKSDSLKSDPETQFDRIGTKPQIRIVNNTPSFRMIGINCAFCHTGTISSQGKQEIIDGGQSAVSISRLLSELVISTLAVMINYEGIGVPFLESFGYDQKQAQVLAKKMEKSLLKNGKLVTKVRLLLQKYKILKEFPSYGLEGEFDNIQNHLIKLIKLTYHLPENQSIGNENEKRIAFIARLATSGQKKTKETHTWKKSISTEGGFGRVDAFPGATNILLRKRENHVDLTSPVGFPTIWGISYKYNLHYTANTNSVLLRNVGQAMSGGAVLLDDQMNSTVNVDNLHKLEKLMYKIKSPDITKLENQIIIDERKAERGKNIFNQNCLSCHSAQYNVAENDKMFTYPLIKHSVLGTDLNLATSIIKPVIQNKKIVALPEAYMNRTSDIVNAYFKKYNVPLNTQDEFFFKNLRGEEWVRNTYNNETQISYEAKDLAGIWSSAPYLHNNSVPTIWDLLQKPDYRPKQFNLGKLIYDFQKLGFKNASSLPLELSCRKNHSKDSTFDVNTCLDTREPGNSNSGHLFGTDLSDSEKWDLIEYIKTLNPTYSEQL